MATKELLQEIATRAAAGELDMSGWLMSLPDPDPVLRKRGEYAQVLEELTADEQVCTAIQQRKLKTLLKRDYRFRPGAAGGEDPSPQAEALAAALSKDLEDVDMYHLIAEVLDAPYYGHTVAEVMWTPGTDDLRIDTIRVKPRRWFGYDGQNRLQFQGATGAPELVPQHKCIVARHFPTFENPYGLRLLSRCLWPVAFKKGGVRFWLEFCEKYGFPWVLGEVDAGTDEASISRATGALSQMVRSAVGIVKGVKTQMFNPSAKGADVHLQLVRYWDGAISKVLKGQTLTDEIGDTGSYAAAQTHYTVLDDFAAADAQLVTAFMNDLAWSYGQVNAGPDVYAPVFEYVEAEDLAARAELDTKLHGVGVRFRKAHFVDQYRLPEDAFDLVEAQVPDSAQNQLAENKDFAAQPERMDPADQGQAYADGLADNIVPKAQRIVRSQADALLALIERAESYDDARLLLAEALGPDDDDELAEQLLAGMVNAELAGRWAVAEEHKEDEHTEDGDA